MRAIKEIIIHCTATFATQKVTVEQVRQWHFKRGFKDIGYHYLIDIEGNVLSGRPESEIGAHCQGHNAQSIGVAYAGGLDENAHPADTRNEKQRAALLQLLRDLKKRYPQASIHGHNEFAQKACPCFNASKEYAGL